MRHYRYICLLSLALLLATLAGQAVGAPLPPARADAAAFASPLFARVWARTDQPVAAGVAQRSWTWGPGAGPVRQEPFLGAPDGSRPVQYFDKGRMEVNPAVRDGNSPWAATSGLLVVELTSGRVQTGPNQFEDRAPADVPVAGESPSPGDRAVPTYASFQAVASLPGGADHRVPKQRGTLIVATINRDGPGVSLPRSQANPVMNTDYSPETGHNIPDVFSSFMYGQGLVTAGAGYQQRQLFDPVFVLGYPISEAYWTVAVIAGRPTKVLVQLYQRRVLTYVPGFPPAWQVQMGNVGQHYYRWRYGTPLPPAAPVAVPPTPRPPAEAFVSVSGSRLLLHGQPVVLKGTNYWLRNYPFVETWGYWDAGIVGAELAKAHELGANSVRITLPYIHGDMLNLVWGDKLSERVNGPLVNFMTQFLQIAASYDMKVVFVLFDGTTGVDAPEGADWRRELNYVQGIVEPFADDDRVLAWDLLNEPDNGTVWKGGDANTSIAWLGHIAAALRTIDTRHPLTVGMGRYDSLWAAPAGQRVLDFVDFASFHSYDAGHIADQIAAVQQHTGKPVVLSEFGWPTGPAPESTPAATYDEATQQVLYRAVLPAAHAAGIAGVLQWTLWDYGSAAPQHNFEAHFGLVRDDGSFKPAAADFRDGYPALALPSLPHLAVPLTAFNVDPDIGP